MSLLIVALFALLAVLVVLIGLRLNSYNPGGPYTQPQVVSIAISTGNVAAGALSAVLPGVAGKTTWIEGFDLTGGGNSAAAAVIVGTITGLTTACGTPTFDAGILGVILGPAFGSGNGSVYSVRFPNPMPASATNTAITVAFPSFGAGNTQSCLTAYGYQV